MKPVNRRVIEWKIPLLIGYAIATLASVFVGLVFVEFGRISES